MGYTAWRQATREELLTDFEGAGRNDRSLWEALPDAAYHQAVLSRQFGRHDVPDPDHDRVGGRIFSRAGAWRVPSEGPSLLTGTPAGNWTRGGLGQARKGATTYGLLRKAPAGDP